MLVAARQLHHKWTDAGELTVWKLTETRTSEEGIVRLQEWSAGGY